ncbi:MAG TPA: phosphoglycerate kinase, partial [Methanomicrobiales archaeon]|nr:phosphoglycerate kinase [Methanomicrobiales archaeon]
LLGKQAKVILCSHLDRPGGRVEERWRLAPVARCLSDILGRPVESLRDCIGPEVEQSVSRMKEGDLVLLENLRFHPGETANDPDFARALADLADVYVNDAFSVCHRRHASIVGVPKYLPAAAGFLLQKEVEMFNKILESPKRPFSAITGGAKVKDKIEVLENIIGKVDLLLIGGALATTFIRSRGLSVGASKVEEDKLDFAHHLMKQAESNGVKLVLPRDVVVAKALKEGSPTQIVPVSSIPKGWVVADIGPHTIEDFTRELDRCRTVVWNGPMGVFEISDFAQGTRKIASVLAGLDATTVIGGGSTAEAVEEMGLKDKMTHVSTGGGASLQLLAGESLPGVDALPDA